MPACVKPDNKAPTILPPGMKSKAVAALHEKFAAVFKLEAVSLDIKDDEPETFLGCTHLLQCGHLLEFIICSSLNLSECVSIALFLKRDYREK